MKLCAVGGILFLIAFNDVLAKIKMTEYEKTIEAFQHRIEKTCDDWSKVQVERTEKPAG